MSRLNANLLLLAAAALWGFGNIAQKTILEHLDPMTAVGLRCALAMLLLAPFVRLGAVPRDRAYLTSLLRVGVPFALAMAVQQSAYLGTSVTNASFLINTATVLTPIVAWSMLGERPTHVLSFAAGTTLLGALVLSGGLGAGISAGDMAAIASAFGFALWMVELGRHMQRYGNALATACAQFLLAALIALPLGALYGNPSLPAISAAWQELVMLAVFSTAIGFGVQTVAQRYTKSSHAAVIVSAESVFGAGGAALVRRLLVAALPPDC